MIYVDSAQYLDAGSFAVEAASSRLAVSLPSPLLDLPRVCFWYWGFGGRFSHALIGRDGETA